MILFVPASDEFSNEAEEERSAILTIWFCPTCGHEYSDTPQPPARCAICTDDRQYILPEGQRWTTLAELQVDRSASFNELEPDLSGITVTPKVGIGQRGLLVRTPGGNLLWEPQGFVDDAMVEALNALGGVAAIASSHPHLTGASVSISQLFGGIPIYWAADDQRWAGRPDTAITVWRDSQVVLPGLTLVQCGGHFAGSAVLHWAAGADGRGVLLAGDTIRVNADRKTLSFMRSYPNLIPLSPRSISKIVAAIEPYAYNRIYGGFEGELLGADAKQAVRFSAERYISWVTDEIQDMDERV